MAWNEFLAICLLLRLGLFLSPSASAWRNRRHVVTTARVVSVREDPSEAGATYFGTLVFIDSDGKSASFEGVVSAEAENTRVEVIYPEGASAYGQILRTTPSLAPAFDIALGAAIGLTLLSDSLEYCASQP